MRIYGTKKTGQVCSIFDLDVGEAEAEVGIARLPELPEKIQQNLRASLSRLMAHEATKEVRWGSYFCFEKPSSFWMVMKSEVKRSD